MFSLELFVILTALFGIAVIVFLLTLTEDV